MVTGEKIKVGQGTGQMGAVGDFFILLLQCNDKELTDRFHGIKQGIA